MRNPGTDYHRRAADEAWIKTLLRRAPIEAANRKEWELRALVAGVTEGRGEADWIIATQIEDCDVTYRDGHLVLA